MFAVVSFDDLFAHGSFDMKVEVEGRVLFLCTDFVVGVWDMRDRFLVRQFR